MTVNLADLTERFDSNTNAWILFNLLASLAKKEGEAWASNVWLGEKIGVTSGRVRQLIKVLEFYGYIKVRTIGNTRSYRRLIKVIGW